MRREVNLPGNKGTFVAELRVTGPVAFLVAKSQALVGSTARDKPKDAYDIVWVIESWPGGARAAAADFARRPVFDRPEVETALAAIGDAFADTDRIGSRSYARFVAAAPEDEAQLERRAVGAVREFLDALSSS